MLDVRFLYLVLVFLAAFGLVFAVGALVSDRGAGLRRRLRSLAPGGDAPAAAAPPSAWQARVVEAARPIARLATPGGQEEIGRLHARFMNAGIRSRNAPVLFFAAKAGLALLLPVTLIVFVNVLGMEAQGVEGLAVLLALAAVGYYLPSLVLRILTARRQREIFEAFPDALDLMIVCVESGLSLDMAIARAGQEIGLRSRPLADELNLIAIEMRIGATRERAMRNFALRTGTEETSSWVTMMLQADRFGTSIAESLRVHAEGLRVRRRQRAEEQAAKLPLKLLFPLIFCIFPSMLLVLLGPAFIQITNTLFPAMTGN